jgi:hypothetical protein
VYELATGPAAVAAALDLDERRARVLASEIRNALVPVACAAGEVDDPALAELLRLAVARLDGLARAVVSRSAKEDRWASYRVDVGRSTPR